MTRANDTATESETISMAVGVISRRTFLRAGSATAGTLLIGFALPALGGGPRNALPPTVFACKGLIRIAPTGPITFIIPQVEMGQGTYTSLSMLMAEELEVGLDQIEVAHAPPDDSLYANAIFAGIQVTGGSNSIRAWWEPIRRAGATAREMLITAAARSWGVAPGECHAERASVIHGPTARTATYRALAAQAANVPPPGNVRLKSPAEWKLISTPAKRLDTPGKVNGTAQYGIDTVLPRMKIATVAACPVLGGTLASVDEAKARAVPGVRQVVRLADAVAVIGDHMWAAKQGLAAADAKWHEGPNAGVSTEQIVRQLEAASQKSGAVARAVGDVDEAKAAAASSLSAVYEVPFLAHATMEPMNCTVHVHGGGCDVWVGTQVATRAQAAAAKVCGEPLDRVRIHNHLIGCGFGRRLETDFIEQAVAIAKQVRDPVKVVWTREEDVQHDRYRPYYYNRVSASLDATGYPIGWHHRIVAASNVARWIPAGFKDGLDGDAVDGAVEPPYRLPNLLVEYVREEPPGLIVGWWRGVGPGNNIFVVESFIDELAAAAKADPVAYRRALLAESPRALAVLNVAAAKAGWGAPLPAGRGRGVSVQHAFGSYFAQVAEVTVGSDGAVRVDRVVCAVDCGLTVNPDTVRAQLEGGVIFGISATLYGAITLKDGRIEQSNFNDYRVLRINEAPAIEVHLVASGEAPGGIGEPGVTALGPAVANAVFAATGKRIRKLPITA